MDASEGRPVSFTTSDGLTLEGVLHLPDPSPSSPNPFPALVICHPHPLYGGDMRNNIVAILCETAVNAGVAALRFNFRGVGASHGSHDKGRGEREDVAAALKYLRSLPEIDETRVGLAGYSFGAAMAALSVDEQTPALIAVSTPTMSDAITQIDAACPTLLVSGDRDEYSDPDALRRSPSPSATTQKSSSSRASTTSGGAPTTASQKSYRNSSRHLSRRRPIPSTNVYC